MFCINCGVNLPENPVSCAQCGKKAYIPPPHGHDTVKKPKKRPPKAGVIFVALLLLFVAAFLFWQLGLFDLLLRDTTELVGRWERIGSEQVIELFADRRAVIIRGDWEVWGSWSVNRHGQLALEFDGEIFLRSEYEVVENRLRTSFQDGTLTSEWVRVP